MRRLAGVVMAGAVNDFLVSHDEIHRDVVWFAGDREFDELFVEAEGATGAFEILLREEAIVEAFAAADAEAVAVEGESGDDDHVDAAEGDFDALGRFADAELIGGEIGFEAGDLDGFHFVGDPIGAGNDDVFSLGPGFDGEGGGFDFGRHGEEDHDGFRVFEFLGGEELVTGGEAAGVTVLGGDAGEEEFHGFADLEFAVGVVHGSLGGVGDLFCW